MEQDCLNEIGEIRVCRIKKVGGGEGTKYEISSACACVLSRNDLLTPHPSAWGWLILTSGAFFWCVPGPSDTICMPITGADPLIPRNGNELSSEKRRWRVGFESPALPLGSVRAPLGAWPRQRGPRWKKSSRIIIFKKLK